MADGEAETLASLLSGFQGGLGSLFDDLGEPGFAGFHLTPEEQALLAADPVQFHRQSSASEGGSGHGSGSQGTKGIKRERSTNGIDSATTLPDGRAAAPGKPKSPKELANLLQDKLHLLQRHMLQNELLKGRCSMLEKIVTAREDQIARLQELKRYDDAGADAQSDPLIDPLVPLGITIKQFRSMKTSELLAKAKKMMSDIGQQLMLAGPGHVQEEAVLGHTGRLLLQSLKYCTLVRDDTLLLAARNVNEGQGSGEDVGPFHAADAHWAAVVSNLGFSQEQAMNAWLLLDLYSGWHNRVLAERSEISGTLSRALSANSYGQGYRTANDVSGLTEAQLVDKLHNNLVQERCLIFLITDVFYSNVLSAVQIAKLMVHSYPRIPDHIAILSAAAALYRPPIAQDALVAVGMGHAPVPAAALAPVLAPAGAAAIMPTPMPLTGARW
mmetsp:Transcript_38162/g.96570  ORF Transcript_38162/g.96570 Transcript_38162/m.96570 type:complete len:442 (+) Transcript_38162:1601-2926(+)